MAAEDKPTTGTDIKGSKEWEKGGAKYNSKAYSEYFDPCQEAADKSLRCLRRNGGDKSMCSDFFENYRECKKSWMAEMKEEKRKQGRWW